MNFALVGVAFLTVFASALAGETTAQFNMDEQLKLMANNMEAASQKLGELVGVKSTFDKEKFVSTMKSISNKLSEDFKSFAENLQKNSKLVPEEMKKKYDELVKNFQEAVKNFQSPEVQKETKKLQEAFNTSFKKVGDQFAELAKSLGSGLPDSVEKSWVEMVSEMQKTAKVVQEKSEKLLEGVQDELKKKQKQ